MWQKHTWKLFVHQALLPCYSWKLASMTVCYRKLPQSYWFEIIEIYSLKIWEARSPKPVLLAEIKVSAGPTPPELLGKNLFLDSSRCWWPHHSDLCLHGRIFSFTSVWNFLLPLSYKEFIIPFRTQLDNPG